MCNDEHYLIMWDELFIFKYKSLKSWVRITYIIKIVNHKIDANLQFSSLIIVYINFMTYFFLKLCYTHLKLFSFPPHSRP